jgi:pimeloyl-ACP methyl ester carboxylesterase
MTIGLLKNNRILVSFCALAVALLFASLAVASEKNRHDTTDRAVPVESVIAALRSGDSHLQVTDKSRNKDVTWVEAKYFDETYPLTINVVARKTPHPEKVIYLIPSSSLNFDGSFFSPLEDSLAFYLAQNGYLVVGITPREDSVPLDADPTVMADWGMAKHRQDIRMIVKHVQRAVKKPYDILGHSLGAICALDYAATYSERDFKSVMILDLPSLDPVQQPEKIQYAQLALSAYAQLMDSGVYGEYSVAQLKSLLPVAYAYPDADSGQSRESFGLPGNFTLGGLLHISLIFTAWMPGVITPLTGLPQEWPMVMGNALGYYDFALDPQEDQYGLILTDSSRLQAAANEVGSGIGVLALIRDYTSAIADLPPYQINWAGIQEKVIWVNGEMGMGAQTYGAELVSQSGNHDVKVVIVPGYGHIDMILGSTAAQDVWANFISGSQP